MVPQFLFNMVKILIIYLISTSESPYIDPYKWVNIKFGLKNDLFTTEACSDFYVYVAL